MNGSPPSPSRRPPESPIALQCDNSACVGSGDIGKMSGTTSKLTGAVQDYFVDLRRVRASGGATQGRSLYGPPDGSLLDAGDDSTLATNPSAYIETSVVSYLTARSSRDVVVATYQDVTRQWWRSARLRFMLFASELVVAEAGTGDPDAARARLEILETIPRLRASRTLRHLRGACWTWARCRARLVTMPRTSPSPSRTASIIR